MIKFLPTVDAPESTRLPQRSTKFYDGVDFSRITGEATK